MIDCAPIILFVYNRPWHTKQTVEALQKNSLAAGSELFIYSDAAKSESAKKDVDEVRGYIRTITGFKKLTIIEREKNWGLADSIIDGVTDVINRFGRIIVLEDDIVTSPYFLQFMNDALGFYQNEKNVWHISGWNYPIPSDGIHDVFLSRLMSCWGWATWADRWMFYEKNSDSIIASFKKEDINAFNIDGEANFFEQVVQNKKGTINTWAIFWYAVIFQNNGLCLSPVTSYVLNIGLDGSGENCATTDVYSNYCKKDKGKYKFTQAIEENAFFLDGIKDFYKMNKKTKFQRFKQWVKKNYLKEQFNPSVLGVFINPFYFSRSALSNEMKRLITHLKGTVVDVGCGTRPYEESCLCDNYIGLEIDDGRDNSGKNANFYYDGNVMPFENGSVDSVITSQVFEHVSDPAIFLKEINRILKLKGKLLMSVPFIWDEHEQPHDYLRYTSFGIKKTLQQYGFEIVEFRRTANNFSALAQMVAGYTYKLFNSDSPYLNLLFIILFISPINIIGIILSKILPNNDDFYLDNVILARKIDEY
nr:methyltransferase domain-containing protein [uncultured Methylophaga sp.]